MEVAQWDLHATTLALIDGRPRVRAGVVLAGGPSLLHAGRVVQPLGLAVVVPRPLATIHAVLPPAGHRKAPHPGVRHLVHVGHAVVGRGASQQSTMKEGKQKKTTKRPSPVDQRKKLIPLKKIKGKMKGKSGHDREEFPRSEPHRGQPLHRSFIQRRAQPPP